MQLRFGKLINWIVIGFTLGMTLIGVIWWWRPYWLRLIIYRSLLVVGRLTDEPLVESYVIAGESTGFRGVYLGTDNRQRKITIATRDGVKSFHAGNPLIVDCQPAVRLRRNDRIITERDIWYDLRENKDFLTAVNRRLKLDDFYKLAADKIRYNTQVHLVQDIKTLDAIYALVIPCY